MADTSFTVGDFGSSFGKFIGIGILLVILLVIITTVTAFISPALAGFVSVLGAFCITLLPLYFVLKQTCEMCADKQRLSSYSAPSSTQ
jgi:hypothetical protein